MCESFDAPSYAGSPEFMVSLGRVWASFSWIQTNVVKHGWADGGLSSFLAYHRIGFHPTARGKRYYDVAELVARIVAPRTQTKDRIRASVASLVHGSGSINDKLLAIVENGAE